MTALSALNKPITLSFGSSRAKKSPLIVGGIPRADLLPPSVVAERRVRRTVRFVAFGLAASVVLVAAGTAASSVYALSAASALAAENTRTAELLQSQTEYAELSQSLTTIERLTAARAAVGASDVEWSPIIADATGLLPQGATVTGVAVTAGTPAAALPIPETGPVPGLAATAVFTISTGDMSLVEQWMLALPELGGYLSAEVVGVTGSEGVYSAQVAVGLSDAIYSARFAPAGASGSSTTDEGAQQ